ncbi:MAG: hypothetical protein NTZ17_08320 [Phycisphaerae bacterium]|nr:hypothetical protein [Phycisphaerae bacterium]
MQNVLDAAPVIEQGRGYLEQPIAVLLINPAQRRRVPAIEPPNEYSILDHRPKPPNSNNRLFTSGNAGACYLSLFFLLRHQIPETAKDKEMKLLAPRNPRSPCRSGAFSLSNG